MSRLLLASTSTVHGGGYLDYWEPDIVEFLRGRARSILFVPYALHDRDAYAAKARGRLAAMGFEVRSVHESGGTNGPRDAVAGAEAIFVGGGNTFRLLRALIEHRLVEAIRARVAAGMPYLGASAGSNVAGPTIKTTNDMPIVWPPTLDALGLVPFQMNPHYFDPDPASTHMGETREQRLREFHEENETPVVGLREGALLAVDGTSVTLRGRAGARLFRRGVAPEEFAPGARLDFLLA